MLLAAILSKKIYDARVADRERNEPWVLATELDHVKANAFEKATVNGEMLYISEICLLRDDKPARGETPEDIASIEYPRGAHLKLSIKSLLTTEAQGGVESALSLIRGVHVFRDKPVDPSEAGLREGSHFKWTLEEHDKRRVTSRRAPKLKISFRPSSDNNFAGDIIDVAAAYGPRFGGKRVEYMVVIEFEGNIYLKSKLETMEIDVAD